MYYTIIGYIVSLIWKKGTDFMGFFNNFFDIAIVNHNASLSISNNLSTLYHILLHNYYANYPKSQCYHNYRPIFISIFKQGNYTKMNIKKQVKINFIFALKYASLQRNFNIQSEST